MAAQWGLRQKNLKMKNDHCRKSLPPGVNKFFQKGPLRPEKSKKQKRASEEKSHKMKNDPC